MNFVRQLYDLRVGDVIVVGANTLTVIDVEDDLVSFRLDDADDQGSPDDSNLLTAAT